MPHISHDVCVRVRVRVCIMIQILIPDGFCRNVKPAQWHSFNKVELFKTVLNLANYWFALERKKKNSLKWATHKGMSDIEYIIYSLPLLERNKFNHCILKNCKIHIQIQRLLNKPNMYIFMKGFCACACQNDAHISFCPIQLMLPYFCNVQTFVPNLH